MSHSSSYPASIATSSIAGDVDARLAQHEQAYQGEHRAPSSMYSQGEQSARPAHPAGFTHNPQPANPTGYTPNPQPTNPTGFNHNQQSINQTWDWHQQHDYSQQAQTAAATGTGWPAAQSAGQYQGMATPGWYPYHPGYMYQGYNPQPQSYYPPPQSFTSQNYSQAQSGGKNAQLPYMRQDTSTTNNRVPTELVQPDASTPADIREELIQLKGEVRLLTEEKNRMKLQLTTAAEERHGLRTIRRVDIQRYRLTTVLPSPSDTQQKQLEDGKIYSLTQIKQIAREDADAERTDTVKVTPAGVRVERAKEKYSSHVDVLHMAVTTIAMALVFTPNLINDPSAIYDMLQWLLMLCEQCKVFTAHTVQRIDDKHRRATPTYDNTATLGMFDTQLIQLITSGKSDRISDPLCTDCYQLHSFCTCIRKKQKEGEYCFAYANKNCTDPCPQGRKHAIAPAKDSAGSK